jgi:hypothetical protein
VPRPPLQVHDHEPICCVTMVTLSRVATRLGRRTEDGELPRRSVHRGEGDGRSLRRRAAGGDGRRWRRRERERRQRATAVAWTTARLARAAALGTRQQVVGIEMGEKKRKHAIFHCYMGKVGYESRTRGRVKLSRSTQSWPKFGRELGRVRIDCIFGSSRWATFLVSASPVGLLRTSVVRLGQTAGDALS